MKCLTCLEKHSYAFIYIRNDSLNDERGEMKGQTETQLLRQHFPIKNRVTLGRGLVCPAPQTPASPPGPVSFAAATHSHGCLLSPRQTPTLRPPRGWSGGGGFPVLCGSQVFKNV